MAHCFTCCNGSSSRQNQYGRLCQVAWWVGTALIVASWFRMVSPTVGWTGFGISLLAAMGSWFLYKCSGSTLANQEAFVVLDSRHLKSRNETYHQVMVTFQSGGNMMYDGVAFGLRPENQIGGALVAGTSTLDEATAQELAEHATQVYEQLIEQCPEFAAMAKSRKLRISIMSEFGPFAKELCRVVDGQFHWQPEQTCTS